MAIETCPGGIQGLAAAATFTPDTVLLDLGLPGMDGYEIARKLQESETTRNTILIAVTGYCPI
jgi:two-component system, chemotaxis family, CheB/CheR fusion protein